MLMQPPLAVLLALVCQAGPPADGQLLQNTGVYRTNAAQMPPNDLSCYRCHTMDPNDKCATDPRPNDTSLSYKCQGDKRVCMVKRFSYTTSNENSTSELKMWSLERNCTKHCEPGCIVIGERTKLYACTSCCSSLLCNNGTGRGALPPRGASVAVTVATAALVAAAGNMMIKS